jgi:hypothetical protein
MTTEDAMTTDTNSDAFQAGRRAGFAVAALATSAVAFISLLGAEKAILALVLAAWSMREAAPGSTARLLGRIAVGVAVAYLITYVAVIVLFHDKIITFVRLFQQLA